MAAKPSTTVKSKTKNRLLDSTSEAKPPAIHTISDTLRRTEEMVLIRVETVGNFTAPVNKLFSLLCYVSQNQLLLSPVPAPTKTVETPENFMWVSSSLLATGLGIKKNTLEEIKRYLDVLSEAKIETQSPLETLFKRFISAWAIKKGRGRSPSLIGFQFPDATKQSIENPSVYTRLSLTTVLGFSNQPDIQLYQIANRYLTSPGGLTVKRPWMYWYEMLTGNTIGSAQAFKDKHGAGAYRLFKRDTLVPAMAGVHFRNINVILLERYLGDEVTLQFSVARIVEAKVVDRNSDWHLVDEDNVEPEVLKQVEDDLRARVQNKLSLLDTQVERIFSKFDLNLIHRNFKYMTESMQSDKTNPGGYLYSACENDYASEKVPEVTGKQPKFKTMILLGKNTSDSQAALMKAIKSADKKVETNKTALKKRAPSKKSNYGNDFFDTIKKDFNVQVVYDVGSQSLLPFFDANGLKTSICIDVEAKEVPTPVKRAKRKSAKPEGVEPMPLLAETTEAPEPPSEAAVSLSPEKATRKLAMKKASPKIVSLATAAEDGLEQLKSSADEPVSDEATIKAAARHVQLKEQEAAEAAEAHRVELENNRNLFFKLPVTEQNLLVEKFRRLFPRLRWNSDFTGPASYTFFTRFMTNELSAR